jgi:hypothetical protein
VAQLARQEPVCNFQSVGTVKIQTQVLGKRVNHGVETSRNCSHKVPASVQGVNQDSGALTQSNFS